MFFKIKNKLGRARTGVINTKHGEILTPGFAFVATHGAIKSLDKKDHSLASPELTISNTFHLFVTGKIKEIKKAGGLHKRFGLKNPALCDIECRTFRMVLHYIRNTMTKQKVVFIIM